MSHDGKGSKINDGLKSIMFQKSMIFVLVGFT